MSNEERDVAIRELNADTQALKSSAPVADQRLTTLENEVKLLRASDERLRERTVALETNVTNLTNELNGLRTRVSSITVQVIGGVVVAVVAGIVLGGLASLGITRAPAPANTIPATR